MPNHYHATLQPSRPNLSEAIRRLNGVYAQWWNRRHARVGHVFQGRFKAQVVDREDYLRALSRYVVMNPVRAGLAERPEDWLWSSFRATTGLGPAPAFLAVSSTQRLFGDGPDGFASALATQSDEPTSIDRIRSTTRVLRSKTLRRKSS